MGIPEYISSKQFSQDTVAGFALAGIGHRDGQGQTNFLTVDSSML